jgi:hypothetical protein
LRYNRLKLQKAKRKNEKETKQKTYQKNRRSQNNTYRRRHTQRNPNTKKTKITPEGQTRPSNFLNNLTLLCCSSRAAPPKAQSEKERFE